jgi:hypothetical protein
LCAVFDFWSGSTDEFETGPNSDPDPHEKDYTVSSLNFEMKKEKKSNWEKNGDRNLS